MKTRLVLAHGTTFKSFRVTGANQGLSKLTHVTKDLRKWQISSNSDPNIAKVQHSFFKNGDMESSKRQSTSLSLVFILNYYLKNNGISLKVTDW